MRIYKEKEKERILPNSFGCFSSDGWEYVIENPLTPRPWVNILTNGKYGVLISNSGSGFSWIEDAVLSRITRWYPEVLEERWGKFLYLLDRKSGKIFSLTYQPTRTEFDFYQVRHSPGYTIISGEKEKLSWSIYYFVPLKDNLEIWYVLLQNNSHSTRKISIFSYFEWCLGNGGDTHWEYQRTFIETEWDEKRRILIGRKRELAQDYPEIPVSAFHTSFPLPTSFEGDKENFLRRGDLKKPSAVIKGELPCSCGKWGFPIGSVETRLELRPGEKKEVIFLLGIEEEKNKVDYYKKPENVQEEWRKVKDFWREFLFRTWVETPDKAFNIMNNIWLKYQTIAGRIWGRTGFYQTSGAYGFRDQLQDCLIFLYLDPSLTRKQIFLHASHQFRDGSTYHWWHEKLNIGPKKNVGDDYLWLPFVTSEYLEETGDWKFLEEKIPYADGEEGSLLEHCLRAFERAFQNLGKHGLPLIGEGDWNDGLNRMEGGESVWLGEFLIYNFKRFSPIMDKFGFLSKIYLQKIKEIEEAVKNSGWDGKWFLRGYLKNGEPLGSSKCKEASIFLNPQSWAIISGVASKQQIQSILFSVRSHLYTPFGPLLLSPPFTKVRKDIGYITRYAPGIRENGGIYTHAATWWILALCILQKNEEAWEIYKSLLPPLRGREPENYAVEPYVTCGNSDGPASPFPGRGGWTWYTGSSQWLFKVGMEWIIGLKKRNGQLYFEPCWPKEWKEIRVIRLFKNKKREIYLSLNRKGQVII